MHDSSGMVLGLITLAISLLGTVIVTTWRSSAVTTGLRMMVEQLDKRIAEQKIDQAKSIAEFEEKHEALKAIPELLARMSQVERNHSLIPKALDRVLVLEEAVKHSKEMRAVVLRRSRPEED